MSARVVRRLTAAITLGLSAALVVLTMPVEASDAYAPRNGISYINLHERIPDYHVRVLGRSCSATARQQLARISCSGKMRRT